MPRKSKAAPEVAEEQTPLSWQDSYALELSSIDFATESQLVSLYAIPIVECPPPDKHFIESIRSIGVINPIVLAADEEGFRIVAGVRRVAASRIVGKLEIPAVVIPSTKAAAAVIALAENANRSRNPVAEYQAIKSLLVFGMSEQDVSRETGLSISAIKSRLRLVEKLAPSLYAMLERGLISTKFADQARKLSIEAQDDLAARIREGEKITIADIERAKTAKAQAAVKRAALNPGLFPGSIEQRPASARVRFTEATVALMKRIDAGEIALARASLADLVDIVSEAMPDE